MIRGGGASVAADPGVQERNVLQIARKVAATIGADFFCAIAKHLAKALSADCVLIGEFAGGKMEGVRTLGAYLDGRPADFEYELAGSASALVASGRPCMSRSGAQSRFPSDPLLTEVGAQALIGSPLEDPQGRVLGFIMALYREPVASFRFARQMLDIFSTRAAAELRRKHEEDVLRESEQRYRAFIAGNADAMWRVEFEQPISLDLPEEEQLDRIYEHGYVAECNDALARLLGFEKAGQIIGRRIVEVAPPSDANNREANLLTIRSGYACTSIEINTVDRLGVRHHVLRSQWGIIEDRKLERIWGISRDLTRLRQSEQALTASEQRMSDLLEAVQLVVVIVDPRGCIVFCNHCFYEKTGWKPEEVVSRDWLEALVSPTEAAKLRGAFANRVARPESPEHFECTLLGAGGRRWQFEWDQTALRDTNGDVAAWANIGRDVSEYQVLEAQFRQAQKLATIGRLAGGLAHDFNNLLTVVMGYSAALLRDRDVSDPSYLGLTQIRKAAVKGAELTHRLLAFGRRQVLRPEILSLNTVISDAEHLVRQLIGDKISLNLELQPSLWLTRLDAGCFQQVLMNLGANSRDATPRGGRLTISARNATVPQTGDPPAGLLPGEYVHVSVSDTGSGMTEEVRGHLFEPFFTTKENGKGSGLGLSTVYGIVQQSGGSIFVDTAPGKGTTFHLYFPRVQGAARKIREEAPVTVARNGTENILLVEDREDVRRLTSQILRNLGYTVLEADGPTRALELAQDRSVPIHLLLTDVVMPDMDGIELAGHILSYQKAAKVLYMSGYADAPQNISAKLSEPGSAYLQKPFTPDNLAVTIRRVLDER
jgi:PAS domain S-box-containing protein